MKNRYLITIAACLLLGIVAVAQSPYLKVGSNPTTINTSAQMEIESTNKGFLPPRVTQANLPTANATNKGMVAFCTDCTPVGLYQLTTFNAGTTYTWSPLGSGVTEYIEVTTSGVTIMDGSPIIFGTVTDGNISYSTSTGYFTLLAGKTYQLTSNIRAVCNACGSNFQWYTTSGTALGTGGRSLAVNATVSDGNSQATAIFTPTANTTVILKQTTGTSDTRPFAGSARIQQIGTTAVTNTPFSMVGTGIYDNASSGYFDIGALRIQWGTNATSGTSGAATVILPVSFKYTTYTVSLVNTAGSNTGSVPGEAVNVKNTTSFTIYKNRTNGAGNLSPSTDGVDWIAIGQKP